MERLAVSIKEATAALGCCRATTQKLINSGRLKTGKAGTKTLVSVASLKALVGDTQE